MIQSYEEYLSVVNSLNIYTDSYDRGEPIISDLEWDNLYFNVAKYEVDTGRRVDYSPTQSISYTAVTNLNKVTHNHPMLSLAKTKDWNEFLNYFNSLNPNKDVIGMLKLDGLTCSLKYENGTLASAETRGNGTIGEDILHNALVISSIPKKISYKETLILDGEILCTYQNFKEFSQEYKNPRNFAAGSIRLLDSKECAKRKLTFVVWNVVQGFDKVNSLVEKFKILQTLNFTVTPFISNIDSNTENYLTGKATEYGYPIDGLVGRFDDIQFGTNLGSTDHHIKAAFAFKFADDIYETKLVDIEWSMGRTGILTPIAIFEPVDDGESVIQRASLHNWSILHEVLGHPYVGENIKVAKMNMIIPQIIEADYQKITPENFEKYKYISMPLTCPICGEDLRKQESDSGVINLYCPNSKCKGKLINRLEHFCGKSGLDIKGISKSTFEKLIEWGWVKNLEEVFALSKFRKDWIQKPGFGQTSVDKILLSIENTTNNVELHKFITALGIPLIGTVQAKEICKYFDTYEDFRKAVDEKFNWNTIEGFGEAKDNSINSFDYTEADKIFNFLTFTEKNDIINTKIKDLIFVITGKTKIVKNRDELKKIIENNGGKVVGSISKKTNYLINNDNTSTSSKNISAKKLDIPVITEEEFLKMIQ